MKCCENCFKDVDIKERIKAINEKGQCDFCQSNDVYVLDIDKALKNNDYSKNIIADFNDLLDLYTVYDRKQKDYQRYSDDARKLSEQLFFNTNIFNLEVNKISKLLKSLLAEYYGKNNELFEDLVIPEYLLDDKLKKNNGIFGGKGWKAFENRIKYINRFHSNMANKKILEAFFNNLIVNIGKSKRFYRARISDSGKPISNENMGAAPLGLSTPGRLNASGIGYLYLCQDYKVALGEIKASLNDVCTVASFEISEELKLVDLSQISVLSIFSFEDKITYLMNFDILKQIDIVMREISNKNRSEIAYVPTEYMSDLIKDMDNVDGIIYESTIDNDTKDLVLFDDEKVHLLEEETINYVVKGINYTQLDKLER